MMSNKGRAERFHPHCLVVPDNVTLVLYYITRVVGKPVFVGTQLSIFRTPLWWRWIKENNLPPSIANLMNGTLEENYGLKIENADVETTNINLADDSALICERWLEGWRKQCTHRSYRQHDSTEFRSLLAN